MARSSFPVVKRPPTYPPLARFPPPRYYGINFLLGQVWLQYQEVDEASFEDPDKISQSPLSFKGLGQSISLFLVRRRLPDSCLACQTHHAAARTLTRLAPATLLLVCSWCGSSPSRWRIDDERASDDGP